MSPISRLRFLATLAAASWAIATTLDHAAFAAECPRPAVTDRPKIGLALGGGGARGGAHIGVLRKLEELRIPVDYVAGTSMGAIVGGFYAAGMGADAIERVFVEADWPGLFSDATPRENRPLRRKTDDDLGLYGPKLGLGRGDSWLPEGAVAGQKVSLLLETLLSQRTRAGDFDDLPIPFRAVASDLVTGDMVVLEDGQLSWALRASMSVPGVFDPVPQGNALLIDGGVARNLPVDVVRGMGADVVIAVNLEFPLLESGDLDNLIAIVGQLTTLMVAPNTREQLRQLGDGDILVTPQLGPEFGSADFERIGEVIPLGYAAAADASPALGALALGEAEYRAWRNAVEACVAGPVTVQFVDLDNASRFSDEIIRKLISVQPGKALDHARLERDLEKIYALGFIRQARYRVVEDQGRTGVVIHVEADRRGTDFIETGLEITGDSRGTGLDLNLGYLKTDLDGQGSEFRGALQLGDDLGLLAEYYKPLDDELRWILRPRLLASRRDIRFFDGAGNALEEWELDEYGAEVAFGREFGRHAGLFLAVSRYAGSAAVAIGDPGQADFGFDGGEWGLAAVYDRLDNRYLPSHGGYARLQYINSDRDLGADADYEQVRFSLFSARSWDRHTAWFGTTYRTTLDDDAPIQGLFTGGGFLNMSGFERDELLGQHFGFSMLGYRYELGRTGVLPAYAGMTLEYGNAADRRGDVYGNGVLNGSVYLGYDSPLGPLYFGLGWREDHSGLLFLRLGNLLGGQGIGRR